MVAAVRRGPGWPTGRPPVRTNSTRLAAAIVFQRFASPVFEPAPAGREQAVAPWLVCFRAMPSLMGMPYSFGVVTPFLVVAVLAAPTPARQPWSTGAPFADLHVVPGVVTSNDEYTIWLYWSPERFRIAYPDGLGPFAQDAVAPDALYSVLSVYCRADGRSEGLSGPSPLRAQLRLPMHPAAPDVYSVLHPMYWLLALSGREFERLSVVVDLGGVSAVDAQLVRRRLAYGRPRPDIVVDLPGAVVLDRLVAGSPMTLSVSGDGIDAVLGFPAASALVPPARRVLRHCPVLPDR